MNTRCKLESQSLHAATLNRRSVITKGAVAAIAAAVAPIEIARAALCQDPEELSSTDYSFRKYVEYTESWPNKDEACRHCASYRRGANDDACGTCQAIAGSINPNGHCNGWERKKGAG